jgi:hypothetical protein
MNEAELKQLRGRILATARELSTQRGSALEVLNAEVMSAAGITPEQFVEAFPDRRSYLLALLLDFLDSARADAIDTLAQSDQGVARICAAFERYWDSNLKWRPMRELALHFRGDEEGSEILRARLHGVTMIAQYELDRAGWPHPAAAARLLATLCVETAVMEYEAGRALPEVRHSALAYLREPRPKSLDGDAVP